MSARKPNWHDDVFFGLHYDLHAGEQDTELGRELGPEHLKERLLRVKPDWIQCDCKGHAGWTSWPTEVGSTSPGVMKDALRMHRDVTNELGIKLGMHYSGVWDSRAIALHPEWAVVDPEGNRNPNMTCRLSKYDEELMIPQLLELVEKYDIDGFWVDGENWAATACWCDDCKAEFTRRSGINEIPTKPEDENWLTWLAFHRDLFVEHVTSYANAVHAVKPDCLICSNWMYTIRQPEPIAATVDYLSGDYDWIWGADRAAVEGRMLDGRDLSWDLMAWGFIKSGDMNAPIPWSVKPLAHLCQEVAVVIALGGAVMIYNQPQRTGWLTGWHQDRFGEVADFCRARKEVCFQSTTVPQAAVLHLEDHYYANNHPLYNYGSSMEPVEGALHALLECGISTDLLTKETMFERGMQYRLIVVPEQTNLPADVAEFLEEFADNGGHVLLSGDWLSRETPELVGAIAAGEALGEATWLQAGLEAAGFSGPWQPVTLQDHSEALAYRMKQQEPGKDTTHEIVVTRRPMGARSIVAIHGPAFRNYFQGHYPLVRSYLRSLIKNLGINWKVTMDASPQVELVLREKDDKLVINLLNRGASETTMPRRVMFEEIAPVHNVRLKVDLPEAPRNVRMVPDAQCLYKYENGVLEITVPVLHIHTAIVVE